MREREVGNSFRIFRNTVEEYDYTGPTSIKIIDHDKMRWTTFSLGSVLAKCEIWTGELNDVTEGNIGTPHLIDEDNNPLAGKYIIGDLEPNQLRESTLRSAIRSIERVLNLGPDVMADIARGRDAGYAALFNRLKQLCPNNIWNKENYLVVLDKRTSRGDSEGMSAPRIGASVEDVGVSLQAAVLSTIGSNLDDSTVAKATSSARINSAINELAGVTSEMTDIQRRSISDAFDQTIGKFKNSKSALKKFLKNTDDSKTEAAETAYIEALTGDFRREWRSISNAAKEIAATIGISSTGESERGDAMDFEGRMADKVRQLVEKMRLPEFQRFLGKWWLGCSIDLPTIVGLDESGILTPFGAYLFRPFQSFSMGSGIIMKSGNETGFTCVGNSDFQLGDNVTNKTHLGHFSFYFEPVVHEPNHIMIMRDIAFMGYNGGAGCEFFPSWRDVTSNIQNASGVRASLCAALAFHHESLDEFRQDPMSITGEFANGSILSNLETVPGGKHYETADYYQSLLSQSSDINVDAETASASDMAFYGTSINFVCYQGLTAHQGATRSFDQYEVKTQHIFYKIY